MNLLNKLTIKNLKLNKKRTIVTIIGIMLSVALITAVSSIYSSGIKSLITFEKKEQGNFHVAFYDISIDALSKFKNNRGIEEINLTKNIGYAKIDSKNEYKPYAFIKAFTKSSLEDLSINVVEGRLPENENEIVIPTHLETNGRLVLNVGDSITLQVGRRVDEEGYELNQSNPFYPTNIVENIDGEINTLVSKTEEKIVDTIPITYKIVGIVKRPAANIESYSAPGYTFITIIKDNQIFNKTDIYVRYNKVGLKNAYKLTSNILGVNEDDFDSLYNNSKNISEEKYNKLMEELNNTYQFNLNGYLINLESNPMTHDGLSGLLVVVVIVIGIIVFTSVFCIKTSFDISITEKIKQYGMLRSIGATKKQVRKNVFYEATILALIGIPLGILLGLLATLILIIISNYYLKSASISEISLEFSISIIAILIAVILGIITIYLSAFRSARRASHVSPIDSIRNSANISIKSKKIKSPIIIQKTFGIGGMISYKNLKRNKKKYRTTVISIVVSVFVFIALSSFMNLAFDSVSNELQISDYNMSLSSYNFDSKSFEKFKNTTTLDNIEDYNILRQYSLVFKDNHYNKEYINYLNLEFDPNVDFDMTIISIGDYQYEKYIKSLGLEYSDIKDKGILVDYATISRYDEKNKLVKRYMRIYDLNVGDMLSGYVKNESDAISITIGAVSQIRPFGYKNMVSSFIVVSDEMYEKMFPTKAVQIFYKTNADTKLQNDIEESLKGENYNLNNISENVRTMNNLFTLIGIFLYGFIIVISLIGITNIFNTITTSTELRKQEFAMLKSIGMTTNEFNRMIRLETLFMGVKSLLFGIPIGITLSYIIYYFLGREDGIPYKLPVVSILISILAVFLLISLIMKYSISKINKQNIIETIRNENI